MTWLGAYSPELNLDQSWICCLLDFFGNLLPYLIALFILYVIARILWKHRAKIVAFYRALRDKYRAWRKPATTGTSGRGRSADVDGGNMDDIKLDPDHPGAVAAEPPRSSAFGAFFNPTALFKGFSRSNKSDGSAKPDSEKSKRESRTGRRGRREHGVHHHHRRH